MKKLNGKDLFFTTMGSCIGIGIITNTGVAISMADSGVILAYLLAFFAMFIANLPTMLFATVYPVTSPQYVITSWASKKVAGFWFYYQVFATSAQAYMGVASGTYVNSIIPAISVRAAACFIITLFFLLNLLDLKNLAVVQNMATAILLCVLLSFILLGLPKCDLGRMLSGEGLFYGGACGIFDACANVLFGVGGCTILMNFGPQMENPKRNVPRMAIIIFICAFLAFGLVAFVGSGVTPIEEVAGQSMTYQAQLIYPGNTYVIFVMGGVLLAAITTINSNYQHYWSSIIRGVDEGWLPIFMGKRNKCGTPWVLMILFWLMALIPNPSNLNIGQLVSLASAVILIPILIPIWGSLKLPEGDPEGWKASRMSKYFFPTASRVVLCIICIPMIGVFAVLNVLQFTPVVTIFIIVYFAVALIISFVFGDKLMTAGTKRAAVLCADE